MKASKTPDPAPPTVERIRHGLETLRLPEMKAAFEAALAEPVADEDRVSWLWRLLQPQVSRRIENRIDRRVRESGLPVRKTFSAFDFAFQPKLDKDLVMELATLRFLERGVNILLAGMSGTGKSHIAKALALAACAANRTVVYTTSADMLTRLNASLADGSLQTALPRYVRPELLVLDEVGLEQVERNNAPRSGIMQKVLFPRYEHGRSTVITSNIPWDAWGDYLDDHLGAAAILDRLIHRSHVIVIDGPSWRDHEHKRDVERLRKTRRTGASAAT
jgi:DNA replication protein DnaC